MASKSNQLFSIETNQNFTKVICEKDLTEILANFNISSPQKVHRISKNSIDSTNYKVMSVEGGFILRESSLASKDFLKYQLEVLDNIDDDISIRPMKSIHGELFITEGSHCFFLYPFIEGINFDGSEKDLAQVLETIIYFTNRLMSLQGEGLSTVRLSTPLDALDLWKNLDRAFGYFGESLKIEVKNLMRNDFNFFHDALVLFEEKEFDETSFKVIHNDMNHGNILINKEKCFIIDVEDICLGPISMALGHGIFKVFRHSIYKKEISIDLFEKKYLGMVTKAIKAYSSEKDFYQSGIYKIISDLILLTSFSLNGDDRYIYDLNKKVFNLFEFKRMFESYGSII